MLVPNRCLGNVIQVQLALLTAAVKLFIYKSHSETAKALVHKVLKWATEEVDNPDLRDRGFMYWRMLAINPSVAGEVVLAEKPKGSWHVHRLESAELGDAAPQGISTLYEGWEFACCSLRRRLALDPPPRMGH